MSCAARRMRQSRKPGKLPASTPGQVLGVGPADRWAGRLGAVEELEPRLLLATTYLVDSLADNHVLDGLVTLREAVTAANSNLPDGDAGAGSGADVIQFSPALAGQTITLDGYELVVAEGLTITGPGADQLAIDADNRVRHFRVNPGVTLTISGLTLKDGNAGEGTSGGAIYCDGTLALTDCVLSNNRAGQDGGAIYGSNSSPLISLVGCQLLSNTAVNAGGAVYEGNGQLLLVGGRVEGNVATYGGGVYATGSGSTTVDGVGFIDNQATQNGGAVETHKTTIIQGAAEFADNHAGSLGGAVISFSWLTMTGGAFRRNTAGYGGGLYLDGWPGAVLTAVDFEMNTAGMDGGASYATNSRPISVHGGSLSGNRAEASGGAIYVYSGSLESQAAAYSENTARNYGGAIASGGALVIQGGTFADNRTDAYDGGAIYAWNSSTIAGATFTGNKARRHGGAVRQEGGPLYVGGLSRFLSNTAETGVGGAFYTRASGVITASEFLANKAADDGGAVYTYDDDGVLVIRECLLEDNQAGTDGSGNGGAIWSSMRRLEIRGGTLRDNTAAHNGGAVFANEGLTVVTDSLVASNTAVDYRGGGIAAWTYAELNLANTTISGNASHLEGGGLYFNNTGNNVTVLHATITANRSDANGSAGSLGGGIRVIGAGLRLDSSIVAGNFAGPGTTPSDISGVVSGGSSHNLIGHGASAGGLVSGANDNLVGVDPLLGPLADNGGRSLMHALLAGSHAIDAADNTLALCPGGEPVWYDQRGRPFDRLVGLHVDIGACEYQTPGGEIRGRKWFDLDQDGVGEEPWGASIVANGGFEEGSLSAGNWTNLHAGTTVLGGWQVLRFVQNIRQQYATPAEGLFALDLNGNDAGAIAQVLVTEPGRRYRVTFQMAGNTAANLGPKTVRVSAAGTSAEFTFDTTGHTATNMGWATETWEFVAQDAQTVLEFRSLSSGTGCGPMIDNVVVQPYGRDDVRVYLDTDESGQFEAGEPLTFLRPDDPNTTGEDETATYRFVGLPPGHYEVRELLADGLRQVFPAPPGSHAVTVTDEEVFEGLDFGNRWDGRISGVKFIDLNGNGVRDRNLFQADPPTLLMIVDASNTVDNPSGFTVGDVNGDGASNDVIDAELYALLALRQELIDLGWGLTARVGVVAFGTRALAMDMDPAAAGLQRLTAPLADADADGVGDLEQVLRSIRRAHAGTNPGETDFQGALQEALSTLVAEVLPGNQTTFVMVSDGLANCAWSFQDEVSRLEGLGVRPVAWAFGSPLDLSDLRRIDPRAERLDSAEDVARAVSGRSRFGGAGDGEYLEPGMAGVTIYLDANDNGQLDWTDLDSDGLWDDSEGERWTVTGADDLATTDVDETGWYAFGGLPIGTYIVREIVPTGYVQTAPVEPEWHFHRVDLRTGPVADGRDFGNRWMPGCLRGRKGLDADGDGQFEDGEPGQAGVTVYLDLNRNGVKDVGEPSTLTGADGSFQFNDVSPGDYQVREVVPAGFEQTIPAGGGALAVTVGAGQTIADLLLVNVDRRGWLWGLKWLDLDADGERDAGEPGLAGVRVYLDLDDNGAWKSGEPYAWTMEDDPATAGVDERGTWVIPDVVPGPYTVREISPAGFEPSYPPGGGGHAVAVEPNAGRGPLPFGNRPVRPSIEGWKFHDVNRNGQRDRNRIRGSLPHLVLVLDLSDSTRNPYSGQAPGDVNGDGEVDTILDGELAAAIAVNQALIDRGLATTTDISLVVFGEHGFQIDMDPATPGMDLATSPAADADGNGVYDVEEVLRSLDRTDYGAALQTDYAAALQTATNTILAVDAPADNANILFISDGEPNNPTNYADEVAALRDMGVNLGAFGAGSNATMYTLRIIDPDAVIFTRPAELVAALGIQGSASPGGSSAWAGSADGLWRERGLAGIVVYLDQNDNHIRDWTDLDGDGLWDDGEGERWTLSQRDDPATPELDETGRYILANLEPRVYIVRELLPDGWLASPLPIGLADAFLTSYLPFTRGLADAIGRADVFNFRAAPSDDRFGIGQTAYFFDGTDFMVFDPAGLPIGKAARTLSLWVRSADGLRTGNADHIVNWGSAATRQAFGLDLFTNNEWFGYAHGADVDTNTVADTQWHHLAATYDGSQMRVYVDGLLKATSTVDLDTADRPVLIGIRPDLSWNYTFDGEIDDIRIYSRALAGEEIAELCEWEGARAVLGDAHVVRVDYGEPAAGRDFGNYRLSARAADFLVFHNGSAWDGDDGCANAGDDDAIAPDKHALLPGQAAGAANLTSSSRGINGVMLDVEGLIGVPSAQDFRFRLGASGDPATWAPAPQPQEVAVRFCQGAGVSDRITITWPDHAIENTWLQMTIKSSPATGLEHDSVFYFGNLAGDANGDGAVDCLDYVAMKWRYGASALSPSDAVDFDHDGGIGRDDLLTLKGNIGQGIPMAWAAPEPVVPVGAMGAATEVSESVTAAPTVWAGWPAVSLALPDVPAGADPLGIARAAFVGNLTTAARSVPPPFTASLGGFLRTAPLRLVRGAPRRVPLSACLSAIALRAGTSPSSDAANDGQQPGFPRLLRLAAEIARRLRKGPLDSGVLDVPRLCRR